MRGREEQPQEQQNSRFNMNANFQNERENVRDQANRIPNPGETRAKQYPSQRRPRRDLNTNAKQTPTQETQTPTAINIS